MTIARSLLIGCCVSVVLSAARPAAAECPEQTSCPEEQTPVPLQGPSNGVIPVVTYDHIPGQEEGLTMGPIYANDVELDTSITSQFETEQVSLDYGGLAGSATDDYSDDYGAAGSLAENGLVATANGNAPVPWRTGTIAHGLVSGAAAAHAQSRLDPVDPITGEFFIQEVDLAFPSHGLAFSLTRTYRSRLDFNGPMGPSWDHTYNQRLVTAPQLDEHGVQTPPAFPRLGIAIGEHDVVVADVDFETCGARLLLSAGDGTTIRFNQNDFGIEHTYWSSIPHLDLVGSTAGGVTTWALRSPAGDVRHFDADGFLVRWEDANGVGLDIVWSDEKVISVVDSSDRVIDFEYDGDGRLARIHDDQSALEATYGYGVHDELTAVHRGDGKSSRYEYDVDLTRTRGDYVPDPQLRAGCESACAMTDGTCDTGGACDAPVAEARAACSSWLDNECRTNCSDACSQVCMSQDDECWAVCTEESALDDFRDQCERIFEEEGAEEQCSECRGECIRGAEYYCGVFLPMYLLNESMNVQIDENGCIASVIGCCADGSECGSGSCNGGDDCEDSCKRAFMGTESITSSCPGQPDLTRGTFGCFGAAIDGCTTACGNACKTPCRAECNEGCNESVCDALNLPETCTTTCTEQCMEDGRIGGVIRFGRPSDLNFNIVRVFDGNDDLYLENTYGADPASPDFDSVTAQEFGEYRPLLARRDFVASNASIDPSWTHGLFGWSDHIGPVEICPFNCEAPAGPGDLVVPVDDVLYDFDDQGTQSPAGGFEVPVSLSSDVKPTLVGFSRDTGGNVVGYVDGRTSSTNVFARSIVSLPITLAEGATVTLTTSRTGAVAVSGSELGKQQLLAMQHMTLFTDASRRVKAYAGAPIAMFQVTGGTCTKPFHVVPVSAGEVRLSPENACQGEVWITPLAGRHPDQSQAAAFFQSGLSALTTPSFHPTSLSPTRAGVVLRQGIDGRRTREVPPTAAGRSAAAVAVASLVTAVPMLSVPTQATPPTEPLYVFHFSQSDFRTSPLPPPSDDWWDDLQDGVITEFPGCDPTMPGEAIWGAGARPTQASTVRDMHGARWTYYADEHNRILRTVNHETNVFWAYNYDPSGQLTAVVNPDGARTCLFHDDKGNLTRRLNLPAVVDGAPTPDPIDENYRYHAANSGLTWIADPRSPSSGLTAFRTIARDPKGNPIRVDEADGTTSAAFSLVGGTGPDRAAISGITAPGTVKTSFSYDVSGLPSDVLRTAPGATSLTQSFAYDEAGRRVAETTPLGFETTYSYDGALLAASSWNGDGKSGYQTFTYDDDAQMTSIGVGDKVGNTTARTDLAYDAVGSVHDILRVAVDGSATMARECRDVAPEGRVMETVSAEGIRVRYQYDGVGRVLSVEAGDLGPSSRAWDDQCLAHPTGGTQRFVLATFQYDAAGHMVSSTDERGRITRYTHDGFGRTIIVARPDGTQARRGYDAMNAVTWEAVYTTAGAPPYRMPSWSDGSLRTATEYSYDLRGRLKEIKRWHFELGPTPVGDGYSTTTLAYDDVAHTVTTTDDAGNQSVTRSDGLGRVVEERAPGGIARTIAYPDNRTVRVTEPLPSGTRTTESSLTSWGDVATQGVRLGSTLLPLATTQFDWMLRPVSTTSHTGAASELTYDAFGALRKQVTTVPSAAGETLTLTYDRDGKLVARASFGTNAPTASWLWTYDALGRQIDARDPTGAHTSTTYVQGSSLPAVVTDPRGVQFQHTWQNDLNQLSLTAVDPSGPDTSLLYIWDGLGRLVNATRADEGLPSVFNSFSYDSLGGVVTETDNQLPSVLARTHHYDGRGLRTSTAVGASAWTRSYDALGRLSELKLGSESTPIARYTYAGFDYRVTRRLQNQVETRYTYDELGRLTFQREVGPTGNTLATWEWEVPLDGVTRRANLQRSGAPATNAVFGVDAALRLTSEDSTATGAFNLAANATFSAANSAATAATTSQAWRYLLDARNNWAQRTKATAVTTYNRDLGDALRQINTQTLTNDARGAFRTDGTLAATYDALGLVKQVTTSTASRSYRRDALGRVVSETDQTGAITRYAWDGATRVLRERPTSIQDLTIDGELDEHLVTFPIGSARQFLHQDRLGSVFLSTNSSGAPTEWIKYAAYGEPTVQNTSGGAASPLVGTQYGFNGLPHDFTLGLVDMRARMYRPTLGRFLSPDPLGLIDGSNRFAFVSASPLSFRDPFGLEKIEHLRLEAWRRGHDPGEDFNWGGVRDFPFEEAMARAHDVAYLGDPCGSRRGYCASYAAANTIATPVDLLSLSFTKDWRHTWNIDIGDEDPEYAWDRGVATVGTLATPIGANLLGNWLIRQGASAASTVASETGIMELSTATVEARTASGTIEAVEVETYFRTMSPEQFNALANTGKLQATGETFIAQELAYASGYRGVTVELTVRAGTADQLASIGVRNAATTFEAQYAGMPLVTSGWTSTNALFKMEGTFLNIGLGRGTALDLFNNNILNFRAIVPP
jgi:RHS repeat-associated protein